MPTIPRLVRHASEATPLPASPEDAASLPPATVPPVQVASESGRKSRPAYRAGRDEGQRDFLLLHEQHVARHVRR